MTITFKGGIVVVGEVKASVNITPSWVTTAGTIGNFDENTAINFQFEASDPEGGVTYARISGDAFPIGVSLSSSGLLSGTAPDIPAEISETPTESATFVIRATDAGGLTVDRSFSITINNTSPQGEQLWAWGKGRQGRLGDGTSVDKNSPVQVGYLIDWDKASTGSYTSLALKTDGTLWQWGAIVRFATHNSPLQVGSLTTWIDISVGHKAQMAIGNGKLYGWGRNTNQQLANNTATNDDGGSSPIQVGVATNWSKVRMGISHSHGITTDGKMWSWGLGTSGQLGTGVRGYGGSETDPATSPVQVGNLTDWSSVESVGSGNIFAIKIDNTLWTWGGDHFTGILGIGTADGINKSSPVQIGSLTNWSSISGSYKHIVALKTDGTIWTWGRNSFGQLGLGNTIWQSSPVQVGSLTDWSDVSCGHVHSHAIKTDGTLWAWGRNTYIGDETYIDKSSPIQIGTRIDWNKLSNSDGFSKHTLAIKKPVV